MKILNILFKILLIFLKKKLLKIIQTQKVNKYSHIKIIFLSIVISENIFSKYIESDNSKIELILKKIILIYSKFIKKKKLSYFLKYKTNISFNELKKSKEKVTIKKPKKYKSVNKLKKDSKNNVHDRLFNDSITKQEMLDNLLNKYLIDEEEKYTFYPKINPNNIKFFINSHCLNEDFDKKLILSERNIRPKSFNKYYGSSYFNKYIQNTKLKKRNGANSTYSFSCNNINYSDLNNLYDEFNNNHRYMPINKKQIKKNAIPISTKYKNKLYSHLFNEEYKNDLFKDMYNTKNNLNKTSSYLFYPKLSNENNKNSIYKLPFNYDYNPYNTINTNNKTTKNKIEKNIFKKFRDLQKNEKNFEKNKKLIHISDNENVSSLNEESNFLINDNLSKNADMYSFNKNNNTSLYNISSIGGASIKIDKEKEKIKEKNNKIISPEKKEHLFSFGSDLFFIDNNNSNHPKTLMNKTLIKKLQKKNNSSFKNDRKKNNKIINRNNNRIKPNNNTLRTKSNINSLTGNNHMSTNYSGSNSLYNINNIKNGVKMNVNKLLEVQSTNQYFIVNDKKNELNNEGLIFQTTIQTLSDSKIFDLAKEYMSEDDSLDSYIKKNNINSNKQYRFDVNIEKVEEH